MYRVFLFIAFLAYSFSAPINRSNIRRPIIEGDDDTDFVDTAGGGYTFFRKQEIDVRPSSRSPIDMSSDDLAEYGEGSALKQPSQKQLLSGFGQQQLIPHSNQKMRKLLPKTVPNRQPVFRQNEFPQLPRTIPNGYASQQGDLPIQNRLLAQNTYGNQQQDFPFPQQQWNTQSTGFNSPYANQGQNDQQSMINAYRQSSQGPPQRFISQSQQ